MFSNWLDGLALNALILILAMVFDRLLPEPPPRIHPVVLIGRTIDVLKKLVPRTPSFAFLYGCLIALLVTSFWTLLALLLLTLLKLAGPIAFVLGAAVTLRTTFTVRGLSLAANHTRQALAEGRLADARISLRSLVSRDASTLSAPLVAAAAIESVAENTTDSFVAPLLAFAIFGIPGAVAYRAINTLDSMLGHRGKYEYLGKASARLDDLVNLAPARLSALLLLVSGALLRLPAGLGYKTMLRDRSLTASPNAGWTMSAMSGLLGNRLEKVGHYCLCRDMPEPDPEGIRKAIQVAELTAILAAIVALGLLAACHAIGASI